MPDTTRDEMPDTALFWRWVGQSLRPVIGWVLTAIGALALLVGYLGVSREAIVAKQIPYLISGGLGGLALLIIGAVYLGTEDVRRDAARLERLESLVEELHQTLLVRDGGPTASELSGVSDSDLYRAFDMQTSTTGNGSAVMPAGDGVVVLPQGKSYHRPGCPMVEGKDQAEIVPARSATSKGLEPCRLCEPHLVEA